MKKKENNQHLNDIDANHKICNNIKKIRELRNINVKEMAFQLCISIRAYNYIESGQVTININRLFEISTILKVSVEELINFDVENILNQKK